MITVEPKNREKIYKKAACTAFDHLSLSGECIVELLFTTPLKIQKLNRKFRQIDKPTDVLSFPLIDKVLPFTAGNYPYGLQQGKVMLGSVVICKSIAEQNAAEYGHSISRELCYLFVHGLLHLLGYDHMTADDKQKMRSMEEKILKDIGEIR